MFLSLSLSLCFFLASFHIECQWIVVTCEQTVKKYSEKEGNLQKICMKRLANISKHVYAKAYAKQLMS